jgi:hypothetical protein
VNETPDSITVDIYEDEDSQFKQLSVEGTSLEIAISYSRKSVKLQDNTGNYYYFQDVDEARKLRAMLDKFIELNPPIEGR